MIVIAVIAVIEKATFLGFPIFFAVFFYTGFLPSYLVWKGDLMDWINEIVFCGVKKISYTITRLGRKKEEWNVV